MTVWLKAVDTDRMVERVIALHHSRTVRFKNELTTCTNWVEGKVLLVLSLVVLWIEPYAQLNHVVLEYIICCCGTKTTRIHVDVPAYPSISR